MANRLKMALVEAILTLHRRGWSGRRIARELGVDRATVARYLHQSRPSANAANAPIGSDAASGGSNAANAPISSDAAGGEGAGGPVATDPPSAGRLSGCDPWRQVIDTKLALGLTAQRIYQDLVGEYGYNGSYYSVRRFVRRLGQRPSLPFRRLECGPGEEAQVDFGAGAPIHLPDGRRRHTHVFRIVLSHSRKAYSEVVYHQTTEAFLGCLENAFCSFGGAPQRLILDNLRAAVARADWFDPELNPKVRSFAQHYGVVMLPTKPYMARHKGKVERGVGYVKDNALKGRTFTSLQEQNDFLHDWETTVADTRLHGTTRHQVGKLFAEVERGALQPLPRERFPFFHEARRTVHRDGHIEVKRAYYSVPPEYLGRQVWVRWDARLVRVFNDRMEAIAVHVKHEPGRFSTQGAHIAAEKINSVERGAAWLLSRVRRIGPEASRWAEAVITVRGIEGVRVVQGLSSLANRHPCSSIERACGIAVSYDSYRLRTIRALIERLAPKQENLPLLTEHPLIRSLSEYQQLVHASFQKEPRDE